MRTAYRDCFDQLQPLLARVEKPSRYIDHEWGTRSSQEADFRACLIYPDVYEVGLPNQALPSCTQRSIAKMVFHASVRTFLDRHGRRDARRRGSVAFPRGAAPVASFDVVGLHVPHEMAATNYLEALDLAGIPLLARERGEDDPLVIAGGPSVYNPNRLPRSSTASSSVRVRSISLSLPRAPPPP